MFSRAAKSVVKSLGQCSYHVGEENLKAIGAAGEFGQTLSQFFKNGSKLESVAFDEVRQITKSTQKGLTLSDIKKSNNHIQTKPESTQTRFKFDSESKSSDPSGDSSQQQKVPALKAKNELSEDFDVLKKLPVAEEPESANYLQMVPFSLQDGRDCVSNVCASFLKRGQNGLTRFRSSRKKFQNECQRLQKSIGTCERECLLIGKWIPRSKALSLFSARSPSWLNYFNKQNYHNMQSFSINQFSIRNQRAINFRSSRNQSFRFISTHKVNLCSKKSKCRKKIEEYCRKLRGTRGSDAKEKTDPCKSEKKENEKKADSCKEESPKKINPCDKEKEKKIKPCEKEKEKKIKPCEKEKEKKIKPCEKEKEKKIKPCEKEKEKKIEPCKKEKEKKIEPCKKEMPKLDDPCWGKSKSDPCKKDDSDKKKSFQTKKCPDSKKVEPSKKKECPPVFRAPECPKKKTPDEKC